MPTVPSHPIASQSMGLPILQISASSSAFRFQPIFSSALPWGTIDIPSSALTPAIPPGEIPRPPARRMLHGLLNQNRQQHRLDPALGHPRFLRTRAGPRRCDLARRRRTGLRHTVEHPRGRDLFARKRPDHLHLQSRPALAAQVHRPLRRWLFRRPLRSRRRGARHRRRIRGHRHRAARAAQSRRRGDLS